MAIGNTHKKLGKDCTCCSGDILEHRQTHTQRYSAQYFESLLRGRGQSKNILKTDKNTFEIQDEILYYFKS